MVVTDRFHRSKIAYTYNIKAYTRLSIKTAFQGTRSDIMK